MSKIVEESVTAPFGGPRWIAKLSNGREVIGKPSWLCVGVTDWRKLKDEVENSDSLRIVGLTLWVPPYGAFEAPTGKGAYGYFEEQVGDSLGRTGITAVAMAWPDKDEYGDHVKVRKILATGILEHWRRDKWLPCMIGKPETEQGTKDGGRLLEISK